MSNKPLKRISNKLVLDGHLWVVKDDKIIDLTTDSFVKAALFLDKRIVYLPYPKEKRDEIVNYFTNSLKQKNSEKGRTWDDWLDLFEHELYFNKKDTDCINSSIVYHARNGGEIIAGCFGFYNKESDNVSWFYGHPHDTEWLKTKNSNSKRYYTNTSVTPDLIWDERTP